MITKAQSAIAGDSSRKPSGTSTLQLAAILTLAVLIVSASSIRAAMHTETKTETFDAAETAAANGWMELGSRENGQDFGFSDSSHAGGPPGEAGGTVTRNLIRAMYVDVFPDRLTLDDFISASGTIIIPGPYGGNLGHLVGHSDSQLAGQGTQANQMGLLVASSGTRFNVHLSLANGARRESVVVLDGVSSTTVYEWEYSYDPAGGATGNGALTVSVTADGVTHTEAYDLTATDREIGATFDSFGLTSRALSSIDATGTAFIDNVTYTVAIEYIGAPIIRRQPQSLTVPAGSDVMFSVEAVGGDLSYQWKANGVNIPGATSSTYTVANVAPDLPVALSVSVSNSHGMIHSEDAILTVTATEMFDTAVMSKIWSRLPGDAFWLTGSGNRQRGLAYHELSSSLIVVSRDGGNVVVSLDAATGVEQFFLDTEVVSGGILPINHVGISEDGAIYVANLTTSADTDPFKIYRWSANDQWIQPTVVFEGDPGAPDHPGLRWGDNLIVRGSGSDTEILISQGDSINVTPGLDAVGTNIVALLRTADGIDFQHVVPPTSIEITNALPGFALYGLAFGPGANTFFAKNRNFPLALAEFDIESRSGFVRQTYDLDPAPGGLVITIAADPDGDLVAGLSMETPHNVRLYSLSAGNPVLLDQEAFDLTNANTTAGGTGWATFGGTYLFVVNSNNGIVAFGLNPDYAPPAAFSISAQAAAGPSVVLSWPTEAGRLYQVWGKASLDGSGWSRVGHARSGDGSIVTFTNFVPGVVSRIYRVQGQ